MSKKQVYAAPEAETFVVQSEGVICDSPYSNPTMLILFSEFGGDNAAGATMVEDAGYDL